MTRWSGRRSWQRAPGAARGAAWWGHDLRCRFGRRECVAGLGAGRRHGTRRRTVANAGGTWAAAFARTRAAAGLYPAYGTGQRLQRPVGCLPDCVRPKGPLLAPGPTTGPSRALLRPSEDLRPVLLHRKAVSSRVATICGFRGRQKRAVRLCRPPCAGTLIRRNSYPDAKMWVMIDACAGPALPRLVASGNPIFRDLGLGYKQGLIQRSWA